MSNTTGQLIYQVINNVHKDIAKVGIAKSDKNKQQGWNYRGIDSVYNTLSSILSKHGLIILPRVRKFAQTERTAKNGNPVFFSVLEVEYDLIATDGSIHTIVSVGEALDYGDKSINKALTAAYKYALFQAFCIPTESQDPDQETIEVKPLPPLLPNSRAWTRAIESYKNTGTLDAVKKYMSIDKETEARLINEIS